MSSPERPASSSSAENQPLLANDASRLHAALTTLLREKGNRAGDHPDAQYCNLAIPGRRHEVATVSNYFTRLVHNAYRPSEEETTEAIDQLESLKNNDAVIDIDLPESSYICFRPSDIRPERSYLFGMSVAKLENLPQNQFVLLGAEGLVDVANDAIAQILADCLNCETVSKQ